MDGIFPVSECLTIGSALGSRKDVVLTPELDFRGFREECVFEGQKEIWDVGAWWDTGRVADNEGTEEDILCSPIDQGKEFGSLWGAEKSRLGFKQKRDKWHVL